MSRYVAIAFALLVVCTLTSAPRAELSPPPAYLVGGNSAPAPAGDGNFQVGAETTDMVCVNGVCAPRSSFRYAAAGGCSSSSAAGGCSSSSAGAGDCGGNYGAARFPVLRASSNAIYGLLHPSRWFPRARARRAASGCGG